MAAKLNLFDASLDVFGDVFENFKHLYDYQTGMVVYHNENRQDGYLSMLLKYDKTNGFTLSVTLESNNDIMLSIEVSYRYIDVYMAFTNSAGSIISNFDKSSVTIPVDVDRIKENVKTKFAYLLGFWITDRPAETRSTQRTIHYLRKIYSNEEIRDIERLNDDEFERLMMLHKTTARVLTHILEMQTMWKGVDITVWEKTMFDDAFANNMYVFLKNTTDDFLALKYNKKHVFTADQVSAFKNGFIEIILRSRIGNNRQEYRSDDVSLASSVR